MKLIFFLLHKKPIVGGIHEEIKKTSLVNDCRFVFYSCKMENNEYSLFSQKQPKSLHLTLQCTLRWIL